MEQNVCCFTGHRPHKMHFGYDENHPGCIYLKAQLKKEILLKIENGYTRFICGMAMGADIWFAEFVLEIRREMPEEKIALTAVLPHKNQSSAWPEIYAARYREVLAQADETVVLYDRYVPGCMQKRNRYMVDRSECMIAVWGGGDGGTKTTIDYAKKQGLAITLLDPLDGKKKEAALQLHF